MRKWKFIASLFLAVTLFVSVPAQAAFQDMWAKVYSWKGGIGADGKLVLSEITSGVTIRVMARNSVTAAMETLYVFNDNAYTSLTNPIGTSDFASATVCNKQVRFRVDPTDATYDRYVDLIVTNTSGGHTAFVEDFDKYTHSIVIDERPNILHHGMVSFNATTTDETSTGVTFIADTFIADVRVEMITVVSTSTMDVGLLSTGTSGATAGFRKAVIMTTAGYVQDTGVITAGAASVDYTPVSTYGSLLYTAVTGAGATYSDAGGRSFIGHVVRSTATGIMTYTSYKSSATGIIHYWFNRMR